MAGTGSIPCAGYYPELLHNNHSSFNTPRTASEDVVSFSDPFTTAALSHANGPYAYGQRQAVAHGSMAPHSTSLPMDNCNLAIPLSCEGDPVGGTQMGHWITSTSTSLPPGSNPVGSIHAQHCTTQTNYLLDVTATAPQYSNPCYGSDPHPWNEAIPSLHQPSLVPATTPFISCPSQQSQEAYLPLGYTTPSPSAALVPSAPGANNVQRYPPHGKIHKRQGHSSCKKVHSIGPQQSCGAPDPGLQALMQQNARLRNALHGAHSEVRMLQDVLQQLMRVLGRKCAAMGQRATLPPPCRHD